MLADLDARGLVQDHTDRNELIALLDAGPVTLYCGFDPTSDSLHVGSLVPLLMLRRFQDAGHRSIALAGGATGMVGDPSGKSDERNLLDEPTLRAYVEAIKVQLSALLSFEGPDFEGPDSEKPDSEGRDGRQPALLVNNHDWTGAVSFLDFLRDVGKHVTVNTMLAKESIKNRVEGDQGISYTEFSYMLLQANDYYELHQNHGCLLQLGGSDQWGNITAGIDMVRRRSGATAHGLTVPLLTKADGTKFGKTASGAIWLDPHKTLPYEFHQYFLRADDADVRRLLLQLTLLPVVEVDAIMAEHAEDRAARVAQRRLADQMTSMIHGEQATAQANLAAGVLFGGEVTLEALDALRGIVPETSVERAVVEGDLLGLLETTGLASSRGDARRTLADNGIAVNGTKLDGREALHGADVIGDRYVLLQKGKKTRHLVVLV